MPDTKPKSSWVMLAMVSGACAACNGVFAKLTTTELTSSWSSSISQTFGLSPANKVVEIGIRGLFFGLNLLFNAIMWGLFTRALTLATSTVRVSVINTSANFMLTAVLGALIFSERLPGLWWLGAALLVAGSVIISRREEGKPSVEAATGVEPLLDANTNVDGFRDSDEREDDVELRTVKDDSEEYGSSEDGDEDAVLK